jgi:pyridoxal phosphate enzyme (YggS family)
MSFNSETYHSIQDTIPYNITIVAVSKTKPMEDLLEAYEIGVRDFGENYVQELIEKQDALPKDIRWHFIGHLQSNKVKYITPFVHLIHGVDSEKLLIEINKQGQKINRKINCLLQVYIAKEESKFGMDESELQSALISAEALEFVNICGLMGMASFTENKKVIQDEFSYLNHLFETIKLKEQPSNPAFQILSMGMSGDYETAIALGSNLIRLGSVLFGARNYPAKAEI